jgi:D-3-phosphoglycerate dehydrogenase
MINKDTIAMMKDGVKIINMARGDLVNSDDLIEALNSGKVSAYVTDFADEKLLGQKGVVAIPHLGASTAEAEDNCAVMAAHQLDDYLKYGNIKNSVNYPVVEIPVTSGAARVCVFHKNIPAVLSNISTLFADKGINIENLINKSKGDNAVTVVEVMGDVAEDIVNAVKALNGVVRVRVINL